MASFSTVGLYCNHADLSPRHAPFLLGLTNTTGALPGIVGAHSHAPPLFCLSVTES
jgi:ACS family sodium-dependent inorganic phosphate cotransporter